MGPGEHADSANVEAGQGSCLEWVPDFDGREHGSGSGWSESRKLDAGCAGSVFEEFQDVEMVGDGPDRDEGRIAV
jgi:hypothetical protein